MSPAPPQDDVALIPCPGCGRSTLGSIARCTYCKMELGLREGPPPAKEESLRIAERCALCGEIYDGTAHDACPRCAERFVQTRHDVLDRHQRRRQIGDRLVWSLGAAALTGLGALALAGASLIAPTFGAGTALWLASVGGGVVMGLLAGWRMWDREGTVASLISVVGIAAATTLWVRAAVIWANGFNLDGPVRPHPCEVVSREGAEVELQCAAGAERMSGEVALEASDPQPGDRVMVAFREGRLGYWVAAPEIEPEDVAEDDGE